jgi:acyl-CoA synthetase (AMP-forming)/AMP-acid ligase II
MTGLTLPQILSARDGKSPALSVPEGPVLSHEQLRTEVQRHSEALARFGLGRADRVALALPNGPEAVLLFLATAGAAAAAPLNPGYTEDEFRFYLEDTRAKALVMLPDGPEAARRAAAGRLVLELREGRLAVAAGRAGPAVPLDTPDPDDVALVLYTSGTTSRPKRVPLRHRNLVASIDNIVATYGLGPADVSFCVMPLFHVHGLVASTLSTLASGGQVVVPRRFNPLGFWPAAAAHGATWYSASPTLHELLLMRAGGGRPAGAGKLRFIRSCSSSLSPTTLHALERRFGAPVLDAYGMTEASHQMASNPLPPGEHRPGTVGRGTGVEIGIMERSGRLLAAGQPGEVVVRGPNVIDGYDGSPEANAESFIQGWFRTGDQGRLDHDGYLTLIGRIKELINRGGEKIAPGEVDEVLTAHPAVVEAVTFGIPHPTWGEEVAAAIVLSGEVSEKELISHCRERLAEFKVPRRLYFVDSIPRTATGKVQRRHVAAALIDPR